MRLIQVQWTASKLIYINPDLVTRIEPVSDQRCIVRFDGENSVTVDVSAHALVSEIQR